MQPLSRHLARHLVLSSRMPLHVDGDPVSPGERVDAKAVRLALSVLSRAAGRDLDRGDWLDARFDYEHLADRPRETIGMPLGPLLSDVGRVNVGTMVEAHARAAHIRASIAGEPSLGEVAILAPGVHEDVERPRHRIAANAKAVQFKADRTIAAIAHPHADATDDGPDPAPFGYDPRVMAAFSCRYTPVVYLRLLAWTEAGATLPRGWRARRGRGGHLSLEIPAVEMQAALGASGMVSPSAIGQQLLGPVAEDLRRVGVPFEWEFERSPVKNGVKCLRLRIGDPRGARVPKRTRTPTAMRQPRPAPTGLRALSPSRPARG
ncbi:MULTISPECIES: hypothetical protein [Methylobacteriaceae]|uniref:hypothetical protein n=1 Tax=Methylobacterium sp. B4 TaxID=1938755 RepID=UPI000D765EA9|nr:hypothetical protein [Methylobacterium sp. B4]PXW60551.1 hypothetical protein BY998_109154 [Methylobacterium sp. B4]